jgi:hypothetical protein
MHSKSQPYGTTKFGKKVTLINQRRTMIGLCIIVQVLRYPEESDPPMVDQANSAGAHPDLREFKVHSITQLTSD